MKNSDYDPVHLSEEQEGELVKVMAKPAEDGGPSPYHYYRRGASWTWKWKSSVGSRGKDPFQGKPSHFRQNWLTSF